MPYGFYQLVRFIALIGFGILAYKANEENQKTEMILFIALTLLFQPFLKIALGRQIWNVIDVMVILYLILNLLKTKKIIK
jgi:hypothetical protein